MKYVCLNALQHPYKFVTYGYSIVAHALLAERTIPALFILLVMTYGPIQGICTAQQPSPAQQHISQPSQVLEMQSSKRSTSPGVSKVTSPVAISQIAKLRTSSESPVEMTSAQSVVQGNATGVILMPSTALSVHRSDDLTKFMAMPLSIDPISTATAQAGAEVSMAKATDYPAKSKQLMISTIHNLSFGRIVVGPSGGSVTANPDGSVTYRGAVTPDPEVTATPAEFAVSLIETTIRPSRRATLQQTSTGVQTCSTASAVFDGDATLPGSAPGEGHYRIVQSAIPVRIREGMVTMTVDELTALCNKGIVTVGATLHIPPHQSSGMYIGDFPVTIILE